MGGGGGLFFFFFFFFFFLGGGKAVKAKISMAYAAKSGWSDPSEIGSFQIACGLGFFSNYPLTLTQISAIGKKKSFIKTNARRSDHWY